MLVGRRKPEIWVHSFSVDSETRRHKGFTIYRITSIVFPRSVPQALTRIILWKRFSEVKKLYKELVRRHRERHLPGVVPALAEQSYFKRFDSAVIEERRRYILRLLDYAGQEPVLYRSYAFVSFFAHGISPDDDDDEDGDDGEESSSGKEIDGSPLTVVPGPRNGRSNIATIRQSLGIRRQDELSLIDPRLDNDAGEGTRCSSTSAGEVDDGDGVDNYHHVPVTAPMDGSRSGSLMDSMVSESGSISEESTSLRPATSEKASEEAMDYLVDAAMVFSKAVEAEANGDYKQALDRYRVGIDRLLSGAKDDTNATRKKIAKEKSCKYVAKAEEIYERYLQDATDGDADGGPTVRQQQHQPMSPISLDDPSSPIQLLERPLNYLSRYKVVKVIGTVMQVQDVTDKKFYIMKSIRRPLAGISFPGAAVFPQDVPYMVPLVAFFQSTDGSIFLLLRLICAGKLWDFIRSYRKPDSYCPSPEQPEEGLSSASDHEMEAKVDSSHQVQRIEGSPAATEGCGSGYLELINQYNRNGAENSADRRGLHSTADKTEQSRNDAATNDDAAFATDDEVGTEVQADVELAEAVEEEQQVIPSFDTLSKDMDVRELLSCSQQLLKAVTQTLEESTEQTTEPAPETEDSSADGTSNSIEERNANIKSHSSQLVLAKRAGTSINDDAGDPADPTSQCTTTSDLLPEGVIRRWISELVVAVDSLHFNGIVCGDLTMDNLLLGPEGQLMLTYFHRRVESYFTQTGAAVPVAPKQAAVRELYVAPERPLEPKSDYWSVGVIMFEMLTKRPFVVCHPSGVFCYHEVQYPEGVELSAEARDLLEGLLQPDVERRFDFKQIIANPFFDSVDWGDVKRRGHGNS